MYNISNKLKELNREIDAIIDLGEKGLLKSEKMSKVIWSIEDDLKEISSKEGVLTEEEKLSIEKNIPTWRNRPKTGFFLSPDQVHDRVDPIKTVLTELIESREKDIIQNEITSETVIQKGKNYDGRKFLRDLLNQATESIFLRDSYFKPVILDILSEYVTKNNSLDVSILIDDNGDKNSLKASFDSFIKQYKNCKVSIKINSLDDKDHPRYILIDDLLLFNPDHSFDQWGNKTVNIHQVTDGDNISKIKESLYEQWSKAEDLISF